MFSYNENNRSETHLLHFSRSALRVSPRGGGAAAPGKERRHRPATARRAPPEPHPHGRARHGTARLPAACGPADLGAERPNGFAPPRDASLTFLVQFSHFICGPSGAALARPDRRGCGTGAVRAAHRPPRPGPAPRPLLPFPCPPPAAGEGRSPSRSQCGPRGGVAPPRPSRAPRGTADPSRCGRAPRSARLAAPAPPRRRESGRGREPQNGAPYLAAKPRVPAGARSRLSAASPTASRPPPPRPPARRGSLWT